LGDTPDEIAAMLEGAGYLGLRGNPYSCPCGACLSDHLGRPIHVSSESCSNGHESAPLSEAVMDFVSSFDDGLYPSLEAKP